jgi:hypothetical protein
VHHAQPNNLRRRVNKPLQRTESGERSIIRRDRSDHYDKCGQELRPEQDWQAAETLDQRHCQETAGSLQKDTARNRSCYVVHRHVPVLRLRFEENL